MDPYNYVYIMHCQKSELACTPIHGCRWIDAPSVGLTDRWIHYQKDAKTAGYTEHWMDWHMKTQSDEYTVRN